MLILTYSNISKFTWANLPFSNSILTQKTCHGVATEYMCYSGLHARHPTGHYITNYCRCYLVSVFAVY